MNREEFNKWINSQIRLSDNQRNKTMYALGYVNALKDVRDKLKELEDE